SRGHAYVVAGKPNRRASDPRASLRVGLVLRPRPLEGCKLHAGGIDGDELGESIERYFQTPRIVDLRHQANIGERDGAAEGIEARTDHRLQCFEAHEEPMVVPAIDLGLVLPQLVLEIAQR